MKHTEARAALDYSPCAGGAVAGRRVSPIIAFDPAGRGAAGFGAAGGGEVVGATRRVAAKRGITRSCRRDAAGDGSTAMTRRRAMPQAQSDAACSKLPLHRARASGPIGVQ